MMTKTQKIFFIVATVLCAVALIWGAIATYFAVHTLAELFAPQPENSIGVVVFFLFFILFFLLQGCFTVVSVPFYVMGPLSAPPSKKRIAAIVMLVLEVVLFLGNTVCFVIGL